jgi:hypothetical protein
MLPISAPSVKDFTMIGTPSPEVTVSICLVPSPEFSQAPQYSLLVHLCRFAVRFDDLHRLVAFPGSLASTTSRQPKLSIVIASQNNEHPDLPKCSSYSLKPGLPTPGQFSFLRPHIAPITKYRNINLFPISYASLPRLRGRLTLRRLPLRRKPWTSGVRVFLPHYRYSCQHSHF